MALEPKTATGIAKLIDDAKRAKQGAWQSQAILRHYELLGRHLGMFTEKVEIGPDQKLMELLEARRRRATGLIVGTVEENSVNEETETEPAQEKKEEPKAN